MFGYEIGQVMQFKFVSYGPETDSCSKRRIHIANVCNQSEPQNIWTQERWSKWGMEYIT